MEKLNLTKKEKDKIKKTLNLVLDDMRELWQRADAKSISINISKYIDKYQGNIFLLINKKRISIIEYHSDNTHSDNLELKILNKTTRTIGNYDKALSLIENYEEIRQRIEKTINDNLAQKGQSFVKLEEINKKYDKEASIDIELPETNNQHQIEVIEEEGQKIGIINFGDRTIKIITNGNIVLVNRETNPKIKRK